MANNYEVGTVSPYFPKSIVEKYSLPDGADYEDHGNDTVYIFVEEGCDDWDALADQLQKMLVEWWGIDNDAPKYAYIKVAYYCSKVRQDEFGGFAIFVTRKNKYWTSVDQFINEQINKLEKGEIE
jgi:hypothetical protein